MSDSMGSSYNFHASLKLSKLKPLQSWLPKLKTTSMPKTTEDFLPSPYGANSGTPPKALLVKRAHDHVHLGYTPSSASHGGVSKSCYKHNSSTVGPASSHPTPRLVPFYASGHVQQLNVSKKADSTATLFELDRDPDSFQSLNSFKLPPISSAPAAKIRTDDDKDYQKRFSRHESTGNLTLHSDSPGAVMSPEDALLDCRLHLSDYERSEILRFREIYFAGLPGIQKLGPHQRKPIPTLTACNDDEEDTELANQQSYVNRGAGGPEQCHFDDFRGDYKIVKDDHLAYRYQILGILGKGSFGQVVKALDHKTNTQVAVKLIRNETRFEKQALVELKILQQIARQVQGSSRESHVVNIRDHFKFRNHVCIVFDLMGKNLYEWIKAGEFHGLHLGLIKSIAYQILSCLKLLEAQKIVHCDLKPENILLREVGYERPELSDLHSASNGGRASGSMLNFWGKRHEVEIIDFGSACKVNEKVFSYIQSRFYRSPEVILGLDYNTAIDMWSLGCILIELYTGYPLFPGENEQDQLHCIMEVCGLPPSHILTKATRRRLFFDSNKNPRPYTNSRGRSRKPLAKTLFDITRTADSEFLNFVQACLDWDPESRIKPSQAMLHPWFSELYGTNAQTFETKIYKVPSALPTARAAYGTLSVSKVVENLSEKSVSARKIPPALTANSASSSSSSLHTELTASEPYGSIKSSKSSSSVSSMKSSGSRQYTGKPVFALPSSILSNVPVDLAVETAPLCPQRKSFDFQTAYLDGTVAGKHGLLSEATTHSATNRHPHNAPKVAKSFPSPFSFPYSSNLKPEAFSSKNYAKNAHLNNAANVDVFRTVKRFFVGN